MPSSPTTRNRLEKQAVGENVNTWGDKLNQTGLDLIDEAMDGVSTIAIASTAVTLTSSNYATDQSRKRVLVFTGTLTGNTTVTAPGVEKVYLVDDQTARSGFSLTLKTSGGAGYALRPGPQWVYCDATDVRRGQPRMDQLPLPAGAVDMNGQSLTNAAAGSFSQPVTVGAPTANLHAATKQYVDATAFAAAGGTLPGQTGSAGYFLTTNGSVAGWAPAPVLSFNGRTGAIAPQAGDYTAGQVGALPASGGVLNGPAIVADAQGGAIAGGATATPDVTPTTGKQCFSYTINGNCALGALAGTAAMAADTAVAGSVYLTFTGAYTVTVASSYKLPSGVTNSITGAAGEVWRLDFQYRKTAGRCSAAVIKEAS